MPNIKPVSDLRNYGEVLRDVAPGHTVFLTRNGHGRYAVLDMEEYQEYERMKAMRNLMREVKKGRRPGEENGYIPADEVFQICHLLETCLSSQRQKSRKLTESDATSRAI